MSNDIKIKDLEPGQIYNGEILIFDGDSECGYNIETGLFLGATEYKDRTELRTELKFLYNNKVTKFSLFGNSGFSIFLTKMDMT